MSNFTPLAALVKKNPCPVTSMMMGEPVHVLGHTRSGLVQASQPPIALNEVTVEISAIPATWDDVVGCGGTRVAGILRTAVDALNYNGLSYGLCIGSTWATRTWRNCHCNLTAYLSWTRHDVAAIALRVGRRTKDAQQD
jgi:hypothetical protein